MMYGQTLAAIAVAMLFSVSGFGTLPESQEDIFDQISGRSGEAPFVVGACKGLNGEWISNHFWEAGATLTSCGTKCRDIAACTHFTYKQNEVCGLYTACTEMWTTGNYYDTTWDSFKTYTKVAYNAALSADGSSSYSYGTPISSGFGFGPG